MQRFPFLMAPTHPRNRRRIDAAAKRASLKSALLRVGKGVAQVGLILGLAVAAGYFAPDAYRWARHSKALAVKQIHFRGLQRLTESELLRVAGLSLGKNLIDLDPEAAERALSAHPWVKRSEVRRQFPSTLTVEIEEHVPEAMVSLGDLYLVDSDGEPFKRVQAGDPGDLLLISGVERESYVRAPQREKKRLAQALGVASAYGDSPLNRRAPLSEVRMEQNEVVLVLKGAGEEVRMGEGNTEEKLSWLERIYAELLSKNLRAEVIHLDNRARPGWVTAKVKSQ